MVTLLLIIYQSIHFSTTNSIKLYIDEFDCLCFFFLFNKKKYALNYKNMILRHNKNNTIYELIRPGLLR